MQADGEFYILGSMKKKSTAPCELCFSKRGL
jgi:hypothetical protein